MIGMAQTEPSRFAQPPSTAAPTSPTVGYWSVVANHTCGVVLGALLMILLHECAHWLTGFALGDRSTLYSFGVDQSATGVHGGITAAAGPLFSFVLGLIMVHVRPLKARGGLGELLWMWLAFISLQEAVTYLVLTPMGAGDTAIIMKAFALPSWVSFVACAIGVAGMFWVARLFAPEVAALAGSDPAQLRAVAFWPWAFGSLLLIAHALLQLSLATMTLTTGETIAIITNGMVHSVFGPMSMGTAQKMDVPRRHLNLPRIPWPLIVGIVVMVAVNVSLRGGITLG